MMASSRRWCSVSPGHSRTVGYGAGGDQGQLGVGEWFDERWFDAGCLDAGERVGGEFAAGGEPGREAAYGLLPDAGGAGCGAGVEHARDPLVQAGAGHRQAVVLAPAQVAVDAVGVDDDGAGALVLGAQGGPPVGESVEGAGGGQIADVGHGRTAQPAFLHGRRALTAGAAAVNVTRGRGRPGCPGNPSLSGHAIKLVNAFRLGIRRF
jgi:hypothetical protein